MCVCFIGLWLSPCFISPIQSDGKVCKMYEPRAGDTEIGVCLKAKENMPDHKSGV